MVKQKKATTLVELILIVLFIGVLAVIAVPRLNFSAITKQQSDNLSKKIVSDFRRTRSLAISDASDNTDGYALNMIGSSPYTGYEIVNLKTSTAVLNGTFSIDSSINCTGGSAFSFGPLGNLLGGSDTQLVVSANGKIFMIDITSATGMVKCTEN